MNFSAAVVKLITTLIRDNVNGPPVVHKTQQWPFHPDEGSKRNPEFEAINGHRGYYLIERLGLGTDGHQEERKYQQMIRDLDVSTSSYDQPVRAPTSDSVPDFHPIYMGRPLQLY